LDATLTKDKLDVLTSSQLGAFWSFAKPSVVVFSSLFESALVAYFSFFESHFASSPFIALSGSGDELKETYPETDENEPKDSEDSSDP
jgi:hypothetical protein